MHEGRKEKYTTNLYTSHTQIHVQNQLSRLQTAVKKKFLLFFYDLVDLEQGLSCWTGNLQKCYVLGQSCFTHLNVIIYSLLPLI